MSASGLVAVAYGAQRGWWLDELVARPDVRAELAPALRTALGAWMATAGVVGIALPAAAAWRWRGDAVVRDVLVAYAGLAVAQVGLEVALIARTFPAMALLSGLTFTTVRLVQLAVALSAVRPPLVRGLLWAGVFLWSGNAAFLVNRLAA